MAKTTLGKTIAGIVAASALTLSVAAGAVLARSLKRSSDPDNAANQDGSGGNKEGTNKSIDRVEKTNTYGLIDEYTIYYTDGTTSVFIVSNGADGEQGIQGFPGTDGHTPTIEIGDNGHWIIDGVDTNVTARGQDGHDGLTPYIGDNGNWWIGETDLGVKAEGRDGDDAPMPLIGLNGNWWIGGTDTGVPAEGKQGRSIVSIEKTESLGLVDTYTITYSDETTSVFYVTNGADGAQGQGVPGQGGYIPEITVENGKWVIDGVPTEYDAVGPQGPEGPQGISIHTGEGEPASTLGRDGDSYINLNNWDYYVMDNGVWEKVGNIHGADGQIGVNGTSVYADSGDPVTTGATGNAGDTYIDLSTGDVYQMGDNGEWGTPVSNSGVAVPHIGDNNHWYVGDEDTGVLATGENGVTPHIGANGHWYVGETDLGVNAQGPQGEQGASVTVGHGEPAAAGNVGDTYIDLDTGYYYVYDETNGWGDPAGAGAAATSVITGDGAPAVATGKNGDSYIDTSTWDYYVKDNDAWTKVGNIKGQNGTNGASVNVGHGDPTTGAVAGNAGDTYIDLETGNYYTYDETNGWGEPTGSGAIGTSLRTGTVNPTAELGNNGDSYLNTASWDYFVKENGAWVLKTNIRGDDGISITSVEKTSTVGLVDTYTITYSDSTNENPHIETFTITNGEDGNKIIVEAVAPTDATVANVGDNYLDVVTWHYYVLTDAGWDDKGSIKGDQGEQGVSITDISYTSTVGLVDTYTITYSDSTNENPHTDTFTVTNGRDGTSLKTGYGNPNLANVDDPLTTTVDESRDDPVTGIEGDSFLDLQSWDIYVLEDDGNEGLEWVFKGNIHNIPDTYDITFNTDGGSTAPNAQEVQAGYGITKPDDPTKEGYFFQGWFTPDGYRWNFEKDLPAADIELTAHWSHFRVTDGIVTAYVDDETATDVVIPALFNGETVIGIANDVFKNKTNITSVTIPNTVITIGDSAFEGCTGLSAIELPSSVRSVGASAFKGCANVTSLYLNDGLIVLGASAFENCSKITSVVIPDSVNSVGSAAFKGCALLETMVLPFLGDSRTGTNQYFTYIFGDNAGEATNVPATLHDVVLTGGNGLTKDTLPEGAFENCANLTNVVLPNVINNPNGVKTANGTYGITEISARAFKGCAGLTSINIPATVTMIGESAYEGCTGLAVLVIPSYVENIGDSAFKDCTNLKRLVVSDGVSAIGASAFENCSSLTAVVISKDIAEIGNSAFKGCAALESFTFPTFSTFKLVVGSGEPDSNISGSVYYDETNNVLYMYADPNTGWMSEPSLLTGGHGNPTNETQGMQYFNVDNYSVWSNQGSGWELIASDIRESTSLSSGAFANFFGTTTTELATAVPHLKTLVITDGPSIGANAFTGWTTLEQVIIQGNMKTINDSAFKDCTGLVSVSLSNSFIETIGSLAFEGCTSLLTVTLPNSLKKIEDFGFNNCTSLRNIVLPDGLEYLGAYAFHSTDIRSIVIPGTIKDFHAPDQYNFAGGVQFWNCQNLEYVYFKSFQSDTHLGYEMFGGCSNLKTVIFEDTNYEVYMERSFFQDCTNLETVVLPSGLINIGMEAFRNCSSLQSINIPNNVIEIDARAFEACNNLTYVYINGNSLKYIFTRAFQDCDKLKSFVCPESVNSLASGVFNGCSDLEYIYIPSLYMEVYDYKTLMENVANGDSVNDYISSLEIEKLFEGSFSTYNVPASLKTIEIFGDNVIGADLCKGLSSVDTFIIGGNPLSVAKGALAGLTNLKTIYIPYVGGSNSTPLIVGENNATAATPGSKGDYYYATSTNRLYKYTTYWSSEGTGVQDEDELPSSASSGDYFVLSGSELYKYDGSSWTLEATIYALSNASYFSFVFGDDAGVASSVPASLKEVNIKEGATAIKVTSSKGAFEGCTSIVTINMPNTLNAIEDRAFFGCTGLVSVIMPDSVTTLGQRIFEGCTSLTTAVLSKNVVFSSSSGYYTFKDCTSLTNVKIPDEWTQIPTYFFTNCTAIKSMTFSSSVKSVGSHVFEGCTTLAYVSFANCNIERIQAYTFRNCTSLKVVLLPQTIKDFGGAVDGDYVFENCTSLESIDIPYSLERIGTYVFKGCTKLKYLNNLETAPYLKSIGQNAFEGCSKLESFVIPSRDGGSFYVYKDAFINCTSLKTISLPNYVQLGNNNGHSVFNGCTALEYIEVPFTDKTTTPGTMYDLFGYSSVTDSEYLNHLKNVKTLVLYTTYTYSNFLNSDFKGSTNLETVILLGSWSYIYKNAFQNCTSLKTVSLPDSIATIYNNAFQNCSKLTTINIPSSLSVIYNYAFDGCSLLPYAFIREGMSSVNDYAFQGCSSIESVVIPNSLSTVTYGCFKGCTSLKSVTLPTVTSFKTIAGNAFYGCTSLESIVVPNNVTIIGPSAFGDCNKLTYMSLPFLGYSPAGKPSDNTKCTAFAYIFTGRDYYNSSYSTPSTCGIPTTLKTIIVTGNDYNLNGTSFNGCQNVTTIKLQGVVGCYGQGLLQYCTSLEYFEYYLIEGSDSRGMSYFYDTTSIPETLKTIVVNGNGAITNYEFADCTKAENIYINGNPTSIGINAFKNCSSLTSIAIPNTVASIGSSAFSGCESLVSVIIPDGVTSISNSAFEDCASLENVDIPSSVTQIGDLAFGYCVALKSIDLYNISNIGISAFECCISLTRVQIYNDNTGTHIGTLAFNNCTSLTDLDLYGVNAIDSQAFQFCKSLYYLDLCNLNHSVAISDMAFMDCTSLTTVLMGEDVTSIGVNAFESCFSLNYVVIGQNCASIGDGAFEDCHALSVIEIQRTSATTFGNDVFKNCYSISRVVLQDTQSSWASNLYSNLSADDKAYFAGVTIRCLDGTFVQA